MTKENRERLGKENPARYPEYAKEFMKFAEKQIENFSKEKPTEDKSNGRSKSKR